VHSKNCILNFSKNLIEPNTTAPPESHSETKKERENHVSVVIPFTATPEYKDTMSVTAGDRLLIQEDSETGWIYGKNFTQHTQGWIPDYCIKRYDAWFEELVGGSGKHVEKCAAIRDFDPSTVVTGADDFQFLALKEGEVFTVCERSKSGWNLVINTDGSKQGWVPDNRCKIIREGSDGSAGVHNSTNDGSTTLMVSRGTFVVRRSFEGDEKRGELSLNQGETVSVRQASDSGWTLGVVVTGGTRKEGWFPDWIIDRSIIDPKLTNCSNCGVKCGQKNLTTYVRVSIGSPTTNPILAANKSIQDTYGPICTEKCWEQWMAKHKNSKQILRR
jgi:hypothetical protein